jgi:hypothetical protein
MHNREVTLLTSFYRPFIRLRHIMDVYRMSRVKVPNFRSTLLRLNYIDRAKKIYIQS